MDARFVIVGAGQAARRAAETLRQQSSSLRICIVGDEPDVPYDRPILSKDALKNPDAEGQVFIRDMAYYAEQNIALRLGVRADEIDRSQKTLRLVDGSLIEYDRLLLATGSRARRFSGAVAEKSPVYYLRTLADARALRNALRPGKRVVVLGGGFIGLEVAASAMARGCQVSLIETASALLQRSMPSDVGSYMHDLHMKNGVNIRLNTVPYQVLLGDEGGAVVCTNNGDIGADIVIVGVGAVPNVELAENAQLRVNNGIVVDEFCCTNDPDIFAAGDVTNHFNPLLGRHLRVESWQVAENQPVIAAKNMLGERSSYAELPWLWSDQYDCNLQTLGVFTERQTLIRRQGASVDSFSILGIEPDGRLQAAAVVNCGRDMAMFKRMASSGKPASAEMLADASVSLRTII